MNPETETPENNQAEGKKGQYIEGTYRGARISTDSDQDCWVQSVEASLHGHVVYQSGWFDITEDVPYGSLENAVDRILEDESKIYANEKDFHDKSYLIRHSGYNRRSYPICKLGFFIMDNMLVYAAGSLDSEGETMIYGEISSKDCELLIEEYAHCNSPKKEKELDSKVIKLSKFFYLLGGVGENSRDRITKKDLYSLNAKFYQNIHTKEIIYVLNDECYEWDKHLCTWKNCALDINLIDTNYIPLGWNAAWEEIKTLEIPSKMFYSRKDNKPVKPVILVPPTTDKESINPKSENSNGFFKAAVIMNYSVAAIVLLISIILLFSGNLLDSAGLVAVSAIYTGLTFWFQKTKSDIPAFLMLFGIAIVDIGGTCVLSAAGIALFMVTGLSFNSVLGFPARLFALIVARRYKSKPDNPSKLHSDNNKPLQKPLEFAEKKENKPAPKKADPNKTYYFLHVHTRAVYKFQHGSLYLWIKSTNEWVETHNFTYAEAVEDDFRYFNVGEEKAWEFAGGKGIISDAFKQDAGGKGIISDAFKQDPEAAKREKELQEWMEREEYAHAYGGKYSRNQKF